MYSGDADLLEDLMDQPIQSMLADNELDNVKYQAQSLLADFELTEKGWCKLSWFVNVLMVNFLRTYMLTHTNTQSHTHTVTVTQASSSTDKWVSGPNSSLTDKRDSGFLQTTGEISPAYTATSPRSYRSLFSSASQESNAYGEDLVMQARYASRGKINKWDYICLSADDNSAYSMLKEQGQQSLDILSDEMTSGTHMRLLLRNCHIYSTQYLNILKSVVHSLRRVFLLHNSTKNCESTIVCDNAYNKLCSNKLYKTFYKSNLIHFTESVAADDLLSWDDFEQDDISTNSIVSAPLAQRRSSEVYKTFHRPKSITSSIPQQQQSSVLSASSPAPPPPPALPVPSKAPVPMPRSRGKLLHVFGSTEGAQPFSFDETSIKLKPVRPAVSLDSTKAAVDLRSSVMSIEESRLSVSNELVVCVL